MATRFKLQIVFYQVTATIVLNLAYNFLPWVVGKIKTYTNNVLHNVISILKNNSVHNIPYY